MIPSTSCVGLHHSGPCGWAAMAACLTVSLSHHCASSWNSSVESSIMARNGDGGPPQVEPTRVASESLPLGERLRPLKRLAMNSRLHK
jgi:hypothetical protein